MRSGFAGAPEMSQRIAAAAATVAAGVCCYFYWKRTQTGKGETECSNPDDVVVAQKATAQPVAAEGISDYLDAFTGTRAKDPFLTYYSVAADKSLTTETYTRGEFHTLALRAASVLAKAGLKPGECHTHFFSCNTVGDLAFRLASVLLATTAVTINWQADDEDKVLYKIELTSSKLVLVDPETPADVIASVRFHSRPVLP